jgi:vacuolar-type H+-ATPase subunit E/Vma4
MFEVRGDLEALVAEAHRRVEQRALEHEASAEHRAAQTLSEAEVTATALLAEARTRTAEVAAEARHRLLAQGEMRAKRTAIERREALLDAVWERAREELIALPGDEELYLGTLRRLAALAAWRLASSEVTLASEPRGRALMTPPRLAAWGSEDGVRYRLAPEPLAIVGGLRASAGRLHVDASFEARLEEARRTLREPTLALLLDRPGAEPGTRPGAGGDAS